MTYVSASIAVNSDATCLITDKDISNYSENVFVASNAAHVVFYFLSCKGKSNWYLLTCGEFVSFSLEEYNIDVITSPPEQATEISLWERLGKSDMLDIESSSFSWNTLSSLHHTEHSSSTEQSEDEMTKPLEVCVENISYSFWWLLILMFL